MNEITQAEFARRNGWSRSHVTGLKHAGRLVMTDDGKRVLVKESIELLKNESVRPDVKQRIDDERHVDEADNDGEADDNLAEGRTRLEISRLKAEAVLRKELAAAELREIELKSLKGSLLRRDEVEHAFTVALSSLDGALDNFRARACMEFAAESDADAIYVMMAEHHEKMKEDFCNRLAEYKRGIDDDA